MKYFAYGANMNPEEMARHCAHVAFLSRARLLEHAFVYDNFSEGETEGWGNVINSPGTEVWGALYEIPSADFQALEKKEGCPIYYQTRTVRVFDDEGREYQAALFYRKGKATGTPSDTYRSLVVRGARSRSLSEAYIERFLNS